MYREDSTVSRRGESLLATHKVLRSTYFLLSLTVLFSAATAWWSLATQVAPVNVFLNLIISIGLLFATMALRNSVWGIVTTFGFTGFTGYTLGPILNFYITSFSNGGYIVTTALGATGIVFLVMSGIAMAKPEAFSRWGSMLFAGVLVIVVASIANIFLKMPMLQLAIAGVAALIFSAFIAYDTSRIINGGERNYIMATIRLYLDILNLFLSLLQLLAAFGGNRN